jgi:two-component system, cell cycle sensor histidine kinase and response regulator CckA
MFTLDEEGTHLGFNAPSQDWLFVKPQDFLGKKVEDVLPADVAGTFLRSIRRTLSEPGAQRFEYALEFDDRGRQDYEARMVVSGPGQVLVTVRNISELKRAQEEFLRSQKLESLAVLASGIAHDFNNLLVGIYGNMDLALQDLEDGSPVRGHIAEAKAASRQASGLISQILAYAGKGKARTEEIDLNEVVREMASLLKTSISKKTSLRFDLARDLLPTCGDPTQVRQIVMNLITNASQAIGRETGEIVLRTERVECDRAFLDGLRPDEELPEGTYASLRVSDTGCGVDAETQQRIFDPFFTTKPTGSGLGLSAVHGIVHSHGGALRVESEPGTGTTFTILFPAALLPAEPGQPDLASAEWEGGGTILVVDDVAMVRTLATRVLERIGLQVISASDGAQAVEVFRKRHGEIDCVLLDLNMPRMDGEETFDALEEIQPGVAVVLTSGSSEQDATQRFAGRGLAGFLQKPYELAKLEGTIRGVLATRQS